MIHDFSSKVAEGLVPVAEMQSQLAHIMEMADDEELRTRFAGFLDAPLDSKSQEKDALEEIRHALILPKEDGPSLMTKWLLAMQAASVRRSLKVLEVTCLAKDHISVLLSRCVLDPVEP